MTEKAAASPDYYLQHRSQEPKRVIGEYVRSHGIPVPLIDTEAEWREALLDGTAMVRSEHQQDYDGLPGIFDSLHLKIDDPDSRYHPDIIEQAIRGMALSNADTDIAYLLRHTEWAGNLNAYYRSIINLGVPEKHQIDPGWVTHPFPISVSYWRYVPGMNITMFRDPHVDGRYYYATNRETDETYNGTKSSGFVDAERYDTSVQLPTYHLDLPAQRVIDLYETVRTLPNFDATHAPVMEMQLGDDNELYFLQYYKTRWSLAPVEAFDLPADGIRVDSARGMTLPDGFNCRLYVKSDRLSEKIAGQAIDLAFGKSESLKQTFASRMASVVLARAGVTLRGTHGARAMLYMPDVTIDAYGEIVTCLDAAGKSPDPGFEGNIYVNARITANGREAVVDSDFKPIYEPVEN